MEFLRKNHTFFAVNIVWTLVLSLGYAFLSDFVYSVPKYDFFMEIYYFKGLFLSIPLSFYYILIKKSKYMWQYFVFGTMFLCLCFIGSKCIIFNIFSSILLISRFFSQNEEENNIFDGVNFYILIFYVIFFMTFALSNNDFLQKTTLYHALISSLLIFYHNGFERLEYFIMVRKNKSNLPEKQLINQIYKIFSSFSLIILVFVAPIIKKYYNFVSFEYEKEENYAQNEIVQEIVAQENQNPYEHLQNTPYILSENFSKIFDFLEPFLQVLSYFLFFYVILKAFLVFLKSLKNSVVYNDDVIENLLFENNDVENIKKIVLEKFDFSYNMKIRRKYKKTLQKYNPKPWQSTNEMEKMAKISIEKLHDEYEKVRYGK